jgi:apyrase
VASCRLRSFTQRPGQLPVVAAAPAVLKLTPGLSAFAASPARAAAHVEALVAFAAERVPASAAAATPLSLLATAGLRALPPAQAAALLAACGPPLAASPFLFRPGWSRLLTGRDEAAFAWVAANYATGALATGDPAATVGVLELGGASAQVAFAAPASQSPAQHRRHVTLPAGGAGRAVRYALYARSFAGAGLDAVRAGGEPEACAAQRSAAAGPDADPDGPDAAPPPAPGHILSGAWRRVTRRRRGADASPASHAPPAAAASPAAAAAFAACRSALASALALASPEDPLPELHGSFLALENLAHTRQYLRLPRRATLAQIADAGAALCASGARTHRRSASSGADDEALAYPGDAVSADAAARHCFGSAYAVALLHDALGLPLSDVARRVAFTNVVRGMPVDWPLGALLAEVAALAPVQREGRARAADVAALALALLGLGALATLAQRALRRTRPPPPLPAPAGGFKRSVSALGL